MTERPAGPPSTPPSVADIFDAVADSYDQTGVDFFRPVAARLVDLLAPVPGDRALDIGCGRGAATVPLAEAVGAHGQVTALDISPAMVERAKEATRGLSQVSVAVGDASELPAGPYDVVAASLVLFFVPSPLEALTSWVRHLAPGGRIGITTFGPRDEATAALDGLLAPYAPPGLLDARTSGLVGPFASDEGVSGLFDEAGAVDVRTVAEPSLLQIADVATWERFSRSTGQRAMWLRMPADARAGVLERAARILTGAPLVWGMRYTLGSSQAR